MMAPDGMTPTYADGEAPLVELFEARGYRGGRGRWLAMVLDDAAAQRVRQRREVEAVPGFVCAGYPVDGVDAAGRIVPHRDNRWPGRWLPDEGAL